MRLLCAFLICLPVCGQTLRISPLTVRRGATGTLVLSLESPAGKEPVALQFEFLYPAPQLSVDDSGLVVAGAAQTAGKSVTCAGRPEDAGTYVYRCILIGGDKRLPQGPLVRIEFRVRAEAKLGRATVKLRRAQGVGADLKGLDLPSQEADVLIQ
jgi:hypothetical protein